MGSYIQQPTCDRRRAGGHRGWYGIADKTKVVPFAPSKVISVGKSLESCSFPHCKGSVFVRMKKEMRISKPRVDRVGKILPTDTSKFPIERMHQIDITP